MSIFNILQNEIDEIHIVNMIIKDSNEIDLSYDIIFDFEENINELITIRKNLKNYDINKLLKICYKYRLKKYKKLNKYELFTKINNYLTEKKKKLIKNFEKNNKDLKQTKYCINNIKSYILDFNDISLNDKLLRIRKINQIFDLLCKNIFFIIIHENFYNTIIKKMEEMSNNIKDYDKVENEKFLKYKKILEFYK